MMDLSPKRVAVKTHRMIERAGKLLGRDRMSLETAQRFFKILWRELSPDTKIEVKKALKSTLDHFAFEVMDLTPAISVSLAREQVQAFNLAYACCRATECGRLQDAANTQRKLVENYLVETLGFSPQELRRLLGASSKIVRSSRRTPRPNQHTKH